MQLPKPVRGFVDGFDAGRYPEVIRGAVPYVVVSPTRPPGSDDGAVAAVESDVPSGAVPEAVVAV